MFVTTPAAPPSNLPSPSRSNSSPNRFLSKGGFTVRSLAALPTSLLLSLSLSLPSPLSHHHLPFLASSSSFSRESLTGFKDSVQSSARRSLKTGSSVVSLLFPPFPVPSAAGGFSPHPPPAALLPSLGENSESIVEFSRFSPRASLFSAFVHPKKRVEGREGRRGWVVSSHKRRNYEASREFNWKRLRSGLLAGHRD